MAILNSSIVFHTNHPDKGIRNNKEFRLALIEELVALLLLKNSDGTFTGGRRPHLNIDRLKGKHFIYKDTNVRKRCVVCYITKTSGKKKGKLLKLLLPVLNINNICVLFHVLRSIILSLIINISVFVVVFRYNIWTSKK